MKLGLKLNLYYTYETLDVVVGDFKSLFSQKFAGSKTMSTCVLRHTDGRWR